MDNIYTPEEIKKRYGLGTTTEKKTYTPEEIKARYGIEEPKVEKRPTLGGQVVRGLVKPVARLGATFLDPIERLATGKRPETKTEYLGDISGYGMREGQTTKERLKDIGGGVLETASLLYGGGGVGQVAKSTLKGQVLRGLGQGAKTGLVGGATGSAGVALQEGASGKEALTQGLIGGVAGLGLGGALGAAAPLVSKTIGTARGFVTPKGRQGAISKEVNELLTRNKSLAKRSTELKNRGIPIDEELSKPDVFSGLKVENGRIVPDEAISTLDTKIDNAMEAKRPLLPELDRFVPKTSKSIIRQRAIRDIEGKFSPADEIDMIRAIDAQLDVLPDELSLSELDTLRARFRASARNAKDIQKRDSEYAALENATRNTLFDITDKLPFDTNKEFTNLNNYIKNLIATKKFVESSLRGQTVSSGAFGRLAARGIGAIAGAKGGPLGALAGSEAGGFIADILANNQLGSSIKMRLIKNITDDPAILRQVEALLQKAKKYTPPARLQLPAGAIRMPARKGVDSIEVLPAKKNPVSVNPKTGKFQTTYSSEVQRNTPPPTPKMSLQNIAKSMTTTANKTDISKNIPKNKPKLGKLSTKGKNSPKNKGFISPTIIAGGAGLSLGSLGLASLKKPREKETSTQNIVELQPRKDGSKVFRLPSGTEVSEMHPNIRSSIQNAYKSYPSLPKGILEAVIMKESSGGYDDSQKNLKIGKYAWLGGLTKIAEKELKRLGYNSDFDTIAGAINSIAKFLELKTKEGMSPMEVYENEYSSGRLSEDDLKKFEDMYKYYSKK